MIVDVDGAPAFASEGGQPFLSTKPSVVFIHGVGMDHTVWGQQTRYMAHHGFNVLAVDLPGHGKTGGKGLSTIEEMADWLNRFLRAAGAEPAILVGHSMGTLVALEAAARNPAGVRALALCGTSAKMGVHPVLLDAAQANQVLAPELMSAWGHGPKAHRGGNIASGMWLVGGAVRLLERAAPGLIAAELQACADYRGAAQAASNISVPVLIVGGRYDKMTPMKAATDIIEALDDVRQHMIPEAGHMMMLEAQAETRKVLHGFFTQVVAA